MSSYFWCGSTILNALHEITKELDHLHLYRWKKFVETSERGEQCRYALATKRAYVLESEDEKILEMIAEMQDNLHRLQTLIMDSKDE